MSFKHRLPEGSLKRLYRIGGRSEGKPSSESATKQRKHRERRKTLNRISRLSRRANRS